jgi:putative DNA primase/helicase
MGNAETIAHALGGRKAGNGWIARCPAHDDRKPSLSLRDSSSGLVLVRCFAGCEQEHVIEELQARGLWEDRRSSLVARRPAARKVERQRDQDKAKRSQKALRVWRAAAPAPGTPVQVYLESRGLRLPKPSPMLRFHSELKHPLDGPWPAMVALVTSGSDGTPLAIHRTFLARDGAGKAPVDPAKMMLGPCGGGAVRLADPSDVLMIGEGIETCLAAMQATGHPAWAALSTSGLRALDLPTEVHNVIVLADGDDAGEAAARDCAWRWKREGRGVRIARPPRGTDFNDILMGRASHVEEAA